MFSFAVTPEQILLGPIAVPIRGLNPTRILRPGEHPSESSISDPTGTQVMPIAPVDDGVSESNYRRLPFISPLVEPGNRDPAIPYVRLVQIEEIGWCNPHRALE